MPKEVAGLDTTWFKGVSYEACDAPVVSSS